MNQALRTLFNIAHRLHNVLGPSWVLVCYIFFLLSVKWNPTLCLMSGHDEYLQVLETLAALDRAIHSPHATTQVILSIVILFSENWLQLPCNIFSEIMNS